MRVGSTRLDSTLALGVSFLPSFLPPCLTGHVMLPCCLHSPRHRQHHHHQHRSLSLSLLAAPIDRMKGPIASRAFPMLQLTFTVLMAICTFLVVRPGEEMVTFSRSICT